MQSELLWRLKSHELSDIAEKVIEGERLSLHDGIRLYRSHDIAAVGSLANIVRERKSGNRTYYIVNRHINYTNLCVNRCPLCAFSRDRDAPDAYTLSVDEIVDASGDVERNGATELHIVGGLHPDLPLSYYTHMLSALKERYPTVHLQAFTVVEIAHMARIERTTVTGILRRLRGAGLGSIPGGGAEIFGARVRSIICPRKISGEEWLETARAAHLLGIKSNATMLYGHVETIEERLLHMLVLRETQDETGGFMSFIPLPFHPANTRLAMCPGPTGIDDLKTIAVSRLMLDNFDHIKAFWIMLGPKLAQVSLAFGADDMDGTVAEERITHAAGARTPQRLAPEEIVGLIREAGREPAQRDTVYGVVSQRSGAGSGASTGCGGMCAVQKKDRR